MFAVWILGRQLPLMHGKIPKSDYERCVGLLAAGKCLKDWYALVYTGGIQLSADQCKQALALAKTHIALFKRHAGTSLKPKHHAFFELTRNMPFTGNPAWLATFTEETLNSMVARLSRSVHPRHFPLQVLKKYALGRQIRGQPF